MGTWKLKLKTLEKAAVRSSGGTSRFYCKIKHCENYPTLIPRNLNVLVLADDLVPANLRVSICQELVLGSTNQDKNNGGGGRNLDCFKNKKRRTSRFVCHQHENYPTRSPQRISNYPTH